MKVCIRDKEGLESVYWIKRRPTMIHGWFTADNLIAKTLEFKPQLPFHIHFTYPLDGDYHFSFEFKDPLTGNKVWGHVYCDRVTRKEIAPAGPSKSESPRAEQYPGISVLMPEHRPGRLDDYLNETAFFSFPTSALPIRDGIHIRKSKISDKDGLDDLVIDVTTLGTGTLNILAQLLGKGVSLAWPSEKYSWSKRDDSEFPNILLLALFYPHATA